MSSYYIDYENVHNEGLNGVDKLVQGDRLCLFYSCKADTLKIDVVQQLMMCAADIRFEKIDNGIENALDFQLITALMCNYSAAESYYIISKDKGYDAAIEMAAKQGRDNIYRCRDIDGALKHQSGLGIDESDQEVIVDLELEADSQAAAGEAGQPQTDGPAAGQMDEGMDEGADGMGAASDSGAEETADGAGIDAARADVFEKIIAGAGREDNEPSPMAAKRKTGRPGKAGGAARGDYSYSLWGTEAAEDEPAARESGVDTGIEDSAGSAAGEGCSACEAADAPDNENEAGANEAGAEEENGGSAAEPTAEELQRRAYQSICTKILNHIKLVHRIPVNYKQAGIIYEALSGADSKMQFYHKLIQILGRKKGGELYQRVKPTYKSIMGIYKAAEQNMSMGAADDVAAEAEAADAAAGQAGFASDSDDVNGDVDEAQPQAASNGSDVSDTSDVSDASGDGAGVKGTRRAAGGRVARGRCGAKRDVHDVHTAAADIRNDFENAEQNQGSPGESIMRMVELVKNI